jgi:hypothetical protein
MEVLGKSREFVIIVLLELLVEKRVSETSFKQGQKAGTREEDARCGICTPNAH